MGKNPLTFLFLHGAGGSASKWRKVKMLLEEIPAIILDLPGHGKDRGNVPTTIEEYTSLLNQRITENVIVVGHSMGGLIALELAAVNEKVKGLVLANSHHRLPVHPKILEQLASGIFPSSFFSASYAKNVSEGLLEEEKRELDKTPITIALADFKSTDRYSNGEKALVSLNIPILAIYGDQDKLLPSGAKDQLLTVNSDVQCETIAGAGHYTPLERADEFTSIIKIFRKKVAEQL